MKKRLVICLLVISMMMLLHVEASSLSDKPTFNVHVPSDLPKVGETFEISVEISNNPGFSAIQFTLSYDSTLMECTRVITNDLLNNALAAANPSAPDGAKVAAASVDSIEGDGLLATYKFTAREDIADFEFKLKNIVVNDANSKEIEYEIVGSNEDEYDPSVPEDTTDVEDEIISEPSDVVEEDDSQENTGSGFPSVDNDTNADKEEVVEPTENPKLDGTENEETVTESLFPDVSGHWAQTFVNEAVKQGLFKGDGNGNFNPDDNVTRAQFITVLWRMAGNESVNIETPFVDIQNQIPEFQKAIAWGYAKGYINGISETAFDPESFITREAGMKILHSYSGGNIGIEAYLYPIYDDAFKDSSEISQWAKSSVYWGIYNKIISGASEDTLLPKGNATRAQLAKILVNYLNID